MNKQALAIAVAMTCTLSFSSLLQAQPPRAMVDSVRVGENRQTEIKSETQRTVEDLDAIIAEFENNGLGEGADVQVLKSIRGVLGNLGEKDMAKVITLLQNARSAPDQNKATHSVANAVQEQKTIIIQLQQLLLEYQRQQELTALSMRFTRLADDQNKNMKAARSLAKSSKGRAYTEQQNAMLTLQQSEQAAIRDQVTAQLKKLEDLGKDADATTTEKINKVLDAAKNSNLTKLLAQAATDLTQNKLFSAAMREKTARDQLRDLARVVAPPKEPMTVIQEAIEVLTGAILEQKVVITDSQALAGEDVAEKAADVEERQADLVDGADLVRKDILEIAPEAAGVLKTSEDKMQEVRAALTGSLRKDAAVENANSALTGLEKAKARLVDQLALLKKQQEEKNALDQVKNLKDQIAALRKDEETLKGDTKSQDAKSLAPLGDRQGTLAQKARDLLLLVTTEAPAASAPMQDAAKDMDSARSAMTTTPSADQATKSEQSAIENLLKAEKALDEKIADLEKAKDDLAKLEKAREDIAKAIEKEQKIETETAKLAAKQEKPPTPEENKPDANKPDANKPDANKPEANKPQANKPEANKPEAKQDDKAQAQDNQQKAADLAKQQDQNAQDTSKIKNDINDAQPDAANAADNAAQNMNDAKKNLDNQNAQDANTKAKDALANLNKAKSALDQKIDDLQKQLGENPDNAANLDNAAKQIEQAQKDVANAQQNMDAAQQPGQTPQDQQGKMDQAGKDLDKAGEEAAKAGAEDKGAMPQGADDALKKAQEAISKSAAAAAKGDKDQAKNEAGKAQDELAKAQAAVAMAQSGMQKGPPSQQAGPPGTPGQPQDGPPGPPGKADEKNAKNGKGERMDTNVNADGRSGGRGMSGSAAFMALPARERDAILQDRKERYPEEYGAMIEKYTKDLSDNDR